MSGGVGALEKRRPGSFFDNTRIMELVPAESCPRGPERTLGGQCGAAVPATHLRLGERGLQGQKAGHGVAFPVAVDQGAPQHHVAAAFSEHHGAAPGGAAPAF